MCNNQNSENNNFQNQNPGKKTAKSRLNANIIIPILLLWLCFGVATFNVSNNKNGQKTFVKTEQQTTEVTKELKGEVIIFYADPETFDDASKTIVTDIIRTRLDAEGHTKAEVYRKKENDDIIVVEFPKGEKVDKTIVELLQKPSEITFIAPDGTVIITNADIDECYSETLDNPTTGVQDYCVSIVFNEAGKKKFAEATAKFLGQPIFINLDDSLISAPIVNEQITNGKIMISGDFSKDSAEELANLIYFGAFSRELFLVDGVD